MTLKSNTEEFIIKAKLAARGNHSFEMVNYKNAATKVTITCHDCNSYFSITPNNYLKRGTCGSCRDKRAEADFYVKLAILSSKSSYLQYHKTKWGAKATDKVTVTCPEHQDFQQTPYEVLNCAKCPKCSYINMGVKKTKTQEEYLKDFVKVHGNKYDTSTIEYKNSYSKIDVGCFEHGVWSTLPCAALQGHGCPTCGQFGFNAQKQGVLYVLKFEDLIKVGISNKGAQYRCDIIRRQTKAKYTFSVIKEFEFVIGKDARDIELKLLKELRKEYINPTQDFDGYTETFIGVRQDELLKRIEKLIEEHKWQSSTQPQILEECA